MSDERLHTQCRETIRIPAGTTLWMRKSEDEQGHPSTFVSGLSDVPLEGYVARLRCYIITYAEREYLLPLELAACFSQWGET